MPCALRSRFAPNSWSRFVKSAKVQYEKAYITGHGTTIFYTLQYSLKCRHEIISLNEFYTETATIVCRDENSPFAHCDTKYQASALKMEAVSTSETSVYFTGAARHLH
jgi:hypothetical protein